MSAADDNPLASNRYYLRARDELADAVLSGRVGLDLHQLTDVAMRRINLSHRHAHELASQFLLDLKTDRWLHAQHDAKRGAK